MRDRRSAPAVVIDASVALKWQLDDEQHSPQALALRDDVLVHERLTAYAPNLYVYEVLNGIVSAVKRDRLRQSQGEEALRHLFSIEFELRTPPIDRTYAIAVENGLSAYDSSYVTLAESLGAELWTADRALYEAVGTALPWVRWIGDYPARADGRDS